MPKKETSDGLSTLASKILSGSKIPTHQDTLRLAGSVLSQDETQGRRTGYLASPPPMLPPLSKIFRSTIPQSNRLLAAVNGPLNTYQKQVGQPTNMLANMLKKQD